MTLPAAPDEGAREAGEQVDEARLRLRRGRLVTAVVAGVLVLVVAVVALLGGFRQRTDQFTVVAVGSTIVTGPFEVTVDRATVEQAAYDQRWDVEVSGTARTTGTTSIRPETGDNGFVFARAVATREVQASTLVTVGPPDPGFEIGYLTPGLPAVPWTVSLSFDRPPGDELLVVVFDQEYTTPWIFGDERGWRPTSEGKRMTLPLEERKR